MPYSSQPIGKYLQEKVTQYSPRKKILGVELFSLIKSHTFLWRRSKILESRYNLASDDEI